MIQFFQSFLYATKKTSDETAAAAAAAPADIQNIGVKALNRVSDSHKNGGVELFFATDPLVEADINRYFDLFIEKLSLQPVVGTAYFKKINNRQVFNSMLDERRKSELIHYFKNKSIPEVNREIDEAPDLFLKNISVFLKYKKDPSNFENVRDCLVEIHKPGNIETFIKLNESKIRYFVSNGYASTLLNEFSRERNKLDSTKLDEVLLNVERHMNREARYDIIDRGAPADFNALLSLNVMTADEERALTKLANVVDPAILSKHLNLPHALNRPMLSVFVSIGTKMILNETYQPAQFRHVKKVRGKHGSPSYTLTADNKIFIGKQFIAAGSHKKVNLTLFLNEDRVVAGSRVSLNRTDDHTKVEREADLHSLFYNKTAAGEDSHVFPPYLCKGIMGGYRYYLFGELFDRDGTQVRNAPLRQKISIFTDITKGIISMHNNLYMHFDIKPANCLISGELESDVPVYAVISDLGGSKTAIDATRKGLTPLYAPPEGLKYPGVKYDSWTLGATILEILIQTDKGDSDFYKIFENLWHACRKIDKESNLIKRLDMKNIQVDLALNAVKEKIEEIYKDPQDLAMALKVFAAASSLMQMSPGQRKSPQEVLPILIALRDNLFRANV